LVEVEEVAWSYLLEMAPDGGRRLTFKEQKSD
jgi:hypothetical protein